MLSLFYKEIAGFFSNITGYLVIIVFLAINSLMLWVIPSEYNIPDTGYATLSSFFEISPWIFLFLVSAVTMRMFAEEKKQGTLELLITRPLSEIQLILAKYFAALVLVLISLIPSIIYYFSIYHLGNPPGNIDRGGTMGSYLGLFFLSSIYVAIGLFSSSITDNQIVAFILSVIISLAMYMGFDILSSFSIFAGHENIIAYVGINEHYQSISRGIIDTRDIIYFITAALFFILLTRLVLESRKWK
jgi:ABC-2 type transport system permease protein